MFRIKKTFMIILFTLLALCGTSAMAEDEVTEAPRDLSGRWIVHLRNSLGAKTCNFDIEQEDERLRGKVSVYGADPFDLDGRFEEDNQILLWATYREPRTGATRDLEFKGFFEGEPGEEVLKGKAEYFDKRYDFVAKRKKKKR